VPSILPADDVGRVLLVRAVEERDPEAVPAVARGDAAVDAGAIDPPETWLARRAALLLPHLLPPYPTLPALLERAARMLLRLVVAAAFLIGLVANYLGPSEHIHLVYNPLVALILWNLGVYVLVALLAVRKRRSHAPRPRADAPDAVAVPSAPAPRQPAASWWLLEWLVPALAGVQDRFERGRDAVRTHAARGRRVTAVARRLLVLWHRTEGNAATLRLRRVLHVGAIALCLGALLGTYVRGIFLEYAVVWRSTFVRDPGTVRLLLDVLLGPASLLLRGRGFETAEVEALMGPAGLPAAPYIHLLAVAAAIYVLVPRALLAVAATLGLRRRGRRMAIDLTEPYYARLVEHGRALQLETISEPLALEMRIEAAKLAEAIAVFVRDRLYDARVVPVLRSFRERGGRIADLEAELATTCQAFEPALERFVAGAHAAYVGALAARAARLIGAEPAGHESVAPAPALGALPGAGSGDPGGALSDELTEAITVTVSTAVALAAGTVSGGIGHTLGLAIVSTLLHTTGPIGFLIGALGAFAVTAGLFDLSRRSVGEWTKTVPLPAAALRLLLRDRKLESLVAQGRERAYAAVKAEVSADLEQSAPVLLEQLLAGLGPVLRRLAAERAP
jgi:Protein of unknown function (DUF2868)